MHIVFVDRESGPEKLVCEAEIHFGADDGLLAGMKLVGISVWKGPEGDTYVTLPSRGFGAGADRKFFDFLRTVSSPDVTRRVKLEILREHEAQRGKA